MKIGEKVKFKNCQFKDQIGTVIENYNNAVIVVQLDDMKMPIATMINNLDLVKE